MYLYVCIFAAVDHGSRTAVRRVGTPPGGWVWEHMSQDMWQRLFRAANEHVARWFSGGDWTKQPEYGRGLFLRGPIARGMQNLFKTFPGNLSFAGGLLSA